MASAISHVYIVYDTDEADIKIGKANTVFKRLGKLDLLDGFDPNRSWQLRCPIKEVRAVEKLLHKRFDSIRQRNRPVGDGYTEWFKAEGYANIIAQTQRLADAMDYTLEPLTAIEPPAPKAQPPKPENRPTPRCVTLQPLRPWITIVERYPHTLRYVFNTDGKLYIYLEAHGRDALDIRKLFTTQRVENSYLGYKVEPWTEHQASLGADFRVLYGDTPPMLYLKTHIRSAYMRCDLNSSLYREDLVPAIKRVSRWIHRQLERPDIRQLTEREASYYQQQYNEFVAPPWLIDEILIYAQDLTE